MADKKTPRRRVTKDVGFTTTAPKMPPPPPKAAPKLPDVTMSAEKLPKAPAMRQAAELAEKLVDAQALELEVAQKLCVQLFDACQKRHGCVTLGDSAAVEAAVAAMRARLAQ